MKTLQIFLAGFIFLFFFTADGSAFRCGSDLVTSGNTKMQVSTACGKPTSKETGCEGRKTTAGTSKNGKISKSKKCANKVDTWYYNCGDNDYIYALTFENGILIKESTEGQGKGKSDCLGK
ncbi:MAG: DUF2845 domain-containing protein [Deltaproteobacteria bacterium]